MSAPIAPPRRAVLAAALALLLSACGADWQPAFDERAEPDRFERVAIADPAEALTFARVRDASDVRTIAVTDYRDGAVHGVELGAALGRPDDDPIALFNAVGYDALLQQVIGAPPAVRVEVPAAQLIMPVELADRHLAAATNFPEHAGDAGVEDGPFLFPKLVRPTGPYDGVPHGPGLLDYEVELAWVTLAPLARGAAPPHMGVVLCNDFTDRDTLLRHVNPWDVASGDGFATGKSFPGYLPVGNLFVVPRDFRRFAAALELRLYVNGALRQRSPAHEMVWDFDEIVARTWAWKDRRWQHRGEQVSLLGDAEVIPARTMLLSGTPHGTIFDGLRTRHYAAGLAAWLAGGWSEPLPSHVVAAYIDDARAAGAYLRPGDRVEIHVDRAGVLRSRVD